MSVSGTPVERHGGRALIFVGIVLLSFNLRPAAVSVGPVLDEITHGLGMSATVAGVLTTLPVVAFAVFGALAPTLAHSFGVHRVTLGSLAAVVAGLGLRARADDTRVFLALSLVALAGMATANVLLPSLVKLHAPDRVGAWTAVYTTALAVGLTTSLTLTVPIADRVGTSGWRSGLAVWALTALLAAVPWIFLVRHDRKLAGAPRRFGLGDVARTRLGWLMAVFFGLQSMQAYSVFGWFAQVYRDAGFSPTQAGLLVGVVAAVSIPLSLWLPAAAARRENQTGILLGVMLCYPLGYLGLILAPVGGAYLWAALVGVGLCTFPLILTLIGLRARTPEGTAALSGFTQSVGYLLAAVGPFGVGFLYDVTGAWTVPLTVLAIATLPQLLVGLAVARPAYIEDQLR